MRTRRETGFSLIELMVALAVASILLTVGVPSFQDMIRDNRLATQANRLVGALNLARSEAIKRGRFAAVCKADTSVPHPTCDPSGCNTVIGVNCWEAGWIVYVDVDGVPGFYDNGDDNLCEIGEDCLIRIFDPLPKGLTLRVGQSFGQWIGYDSLGKGDGSHSGGLGNDAFRLCQGTDTQSARSVAVNLIGRPRVSKGATVCP